MDFVILKVNGEDLSNASHEEAIQAFEAAQEPIMVQIAKRQKPGSSIVRENAPASGFIDRGVQTVPESALQAFTSSLATQRNGRANAHSMNGIVELDETHESSGEDNLDEEYYERDYYSEPEQVYDPIAQERDELYANPARQLIHQTTNLAVVLTKRGPSDKFGLTICYRTLDGKHTIDQSMENAQEPMNVFIGDIEANSVAEREAQVVRGDRILAINGQRVSHRRHVIDMFKRSEGSVSLLLERKVPLTQPAKTNTLDEPPLSHPNAYTGTASTDKSIRSITSEKQDHDSGVGRITDDSMRTEESSEHDDPNSPDNTNQKSARPLSTVDSEAIERAVGAIRNFQPHAHPDASESIDEELVKLGRLMQTLALHCRQLADAKLKQQESNIPPGPNRLSQNSVARSPTPKAEREEQLAKGNNFTKLSAHIQGSMLSIMRPQSFNSSSAVAATVAASARPAHETASSAWSLGSSHLHSDAQKSRKTRSLQPVNTGSDSSIDVLLCQKARTGNGTERRLNLAKASPSQFDSETRPAGRFTSPASSQNSHPYEFYDQFYQRSTPGGTESNSSLPLPGNYASNNHREVAATRHGSLESQEMIANAIYETPYASVPVDGSDPGLWRNLQPCFSGPLSLNPVDLSLFPHSSDALDSHLRDQPLAMHRRPKPAHPSRHQPKPHKQPQSEMEWVVKKRQDGTRYITRRPMRRKTDTGNTTDDEVHDDSGACQRGSRKHEKRKTKAMRPGETKMRTRARFISRERIASVTNV